jgi:asparagine synthase (glutamine-hydrolysing)
MCGIAGILALDRRSAVTAEPLRRMRDALIHRGPDGTGLFLKGPMGLAHTRLAVIDIAAGDQPMANEHGDVHIVFNGEIYNHAELRPGLEARGHYYRSRCDTETILHLYEDEGDAVVEHLRGMFAFAIWDEPRQRLLLARDRLGIKPLYYVMTGTHLLFASEIKALLASHLIRATFNEQVLPEFLSTRFVSGEQTFFRDIRKLLPGHVCSWTLDGPVTSRRYWEVPTPGPVAPSGALSALDLRARIEAAVDSHLMSDVPLGVFLSGGIDSSVLAALVARRSTQPVQTFAVGFSEREANEFAYARLAAGHVGSRHHEVTVSADQFFEVLPTALWHEDEPIAFPSSIPLFLLAQEARRHVKVVLTGEGADELFLGYNRYRVTKWNSRLGHPYWAVTPAAVRRWIRGAVPRLPGTLGWLAKRTFLGFDPDLRDLHLENFAVMSLTQQASVVQRRDLLDGVDPYAAYGHRYDEVDSSVLDRISRADLETYLLELLMKQDQMSMAASIESRVPFLDDRLVEHVASIPGDTKLPGWQTKRLLRAAVQDLVPPAIFNRRKMGFPVPLGGWLAGEYARLVDEFVLGPRSLSRGYFDSAALARLAGAHRSGTSSSTDALWLLINFEIWQRIFIDGEAPSRIMNPVSSGSTREASRIVSRSVACAYSG